MNTFNNTALAELTAQQVRFAPAGRRREQVAKAQQLLADIDSAKQYPYDFVSFKLTDFRSDAHPGLLIPGEALKHDLALFALQVERSLPAVPVEQTGEEVLSLEDVSKKFNVSTKTVSRWRLRGLIGRRVKVNGRSHLGFPRSAVEQFLSKHGDRVQKSAKFSHLSDSEKDGIILSARKLAAEGRSLTDVSKEISAGLGRSAEAVRYTIKNFDRDHPETAVYPRLTGPLTDSAKRQIFAAFQEGKPMDLIAREFARTRSSLYRVVNEVKADALVRSPVDYMPSPEFDDPALHAFMIGPMPNEAAFFEKAAGMAAPKDVDAQMAYLYEKPLLAKDQEQHLFRKMNYLKHLLNQKRAALDPARARVQDLQELDDLLKRSKQCRDLLLECNQRLVHSLATKHLRPGQTLDELKSDANISLMRAVEKFDYTRGFKFSTYATWAVMKNFARSIPDEATRRGRFVTGAEELFDAKADIRTDEQEVLATADAAKARVGRLLETLDPRTRDVIRMRTGLAGGPEMTLEQIGQHFGITKERVRQINVRGMKMLRDKAAEAGEI